MIKLNAMKIEISTLNNVISDEDYKTVTTEQLEKCIGYFNLKIDGNIKMDKIDKILNILKNK